MKLKSVIKIIKKFNNIVIKTEFLIKKFFFINHYIINLNLPLFKAIYENN
jgi:hypothetical protein